MKILSVMFAVLLALPCMSLATPVPDTGQIISYATGDDGYYAPCNPHSYTKLDANGNDLPDEAPWPWMMVRDNVTGLIWQADTAPSGYTWQQAIDYGEDLTLGVYSDWRLPTIKELSTLKDSSIASPGLTINTIYFPNTESSWYWSSTTYADDPYYAWVVYFSDYYKSYDYKSVDDLYYVRAVRAGPCGSLGNFIDNGDGTVTDTDTGLMWQKDTAPDVYMWHQALSYCENLTLGGHSDWRLPNRNELQSIVDYSRYYPSIAPVFNAVLYFYWSSTTFATIPYLAWGVWFYDGSLSCEGKGDEIYHTYYYVRAVRGGHCESLGDLDNDCRVDCIDNCLTTPNGLDMGTCTKGTIAQPCMNDEQCGLGGFCSMRQEDADSDYLGDACDNCPDTPNSDQQDSYPPQGNGIGDACDCEGDFDCDSDVDGTDASTFKADFGRSTIVHPCIAGDTCKGDFNCDGDVDGTDASLFKSDFGRSSIQNPCPACVQGEWCGYGEPFVSGYWDSGCQGSFMEYAGGTCGEDEIVAEVAGNVIHLTHFNAFYNCCPDDISVTLMTVDGNMLRLTEREILTRPCLCMCCYNVESEIAGLEPGEYTIEYCYPYPLCDMLTVVVSQ